MKTFLSDRDVEIISSLTEDMAFAEACVKHGAVTPHSINSTRTRMLNILRLDDITQVRLWASPISDKELARLCGRTEQRKAMAVGA